MSFSAPRRDRTVLAPLLVNPYEEEEMTSRRRSNNNNHHHYHSVAGSALGALQRGGWFYKWTRQGRVHERYVWLDVLRGSLVWGPNPKSSLIFPSRLRPEASTDLCPDWMIDEETRRVFYRIFLVTEECTIVFATELRENFDVWLETLQKIISAAGDDSSQRMGQMFGCSSRPATVASQSGGVGSMTTGKWSSRSSPSHAVLYDYEPSTHIVERGSMFGDGRTRVLPSD